MTALAVFRALWGFLRSPQGQVLALALGAVLLLSLADARAYQRGVSHERAIWVERGIKDAAKARETEAKNDRATASTEAKVETVRTVIKWRTQTLIERIPADAPDRATLPAWLVRLHDEAATGVPRPADGAGEPDAAPSRIGDARLAETVIGNYGACHDSAERLAAFQSWARETGLAR